MRRRQEGYVLLGIVIGIVILGIFMTAAVPMWQKVVQREREQELIFRGYQYMQAIELYQRKYPGAYPPTLEILVEQKFLRRIYEDPMMEEGEFKILRQLSPELQAGGAQLQRQAGAQAGSTNPNRGGGQPRAPGGRTPGQPSTRQPTGGQFQSSLGRGMGDASLGGIVGVASRSEEKTLYQVPGKEKYKDWLFVYGLQPPPGAMTAPGQGGLPGGQRVPGQQVPGQQVQRQQSLGQQLRGQQLQGQPLPGQVPGAAGTNPSPFPGLPPPPGLTSFRFGSAPAAPMPGQQTQPGQPGQSVPPGTASPGMTPRPGRPSQPGSSSFGQPQQPRRQP